MEVASIGSAPCWTCRKRRLVCDSTRPECKKCVARGLTCSGYEHKPLRWIEPGETRSKKHRNKTRNSDRRDLARLPAPWSPSCVARDQVVSLAEAVQYFNVVISPDLTSGVSGAKSPFYIPSSAMPYFRPAVSEMVISVALGHRILQDVDRCQSDRAVLSTRLQEHRGAAIRLLSGDLAQESLRTSDEMIACVLTFLLAEIQQSISTTWRDHVDAASAIIARRGGIHTLMHAGQPISYLLRYFVLIDIIGATTAPHLDIDRANRQLETLPFLPTLFQDGLQTCVPCPGELLKHIVQVNYLRSQVHGNFVHNDDACFTTARALLAEICDMSIEGWIKDIIPPLSGDTPADMTDSTGNVANAAASRPKTWAFTAVGSAFRAATALYCILSLFGPSQVFNQDGALGLTTGEISGMELTAFYVEVLKTNSQAISFHPSDQHLRKFMFWPLAILGIACPAADSVTQKFVLSELQWMSVKVGIASPLICVDFLRRMRQTSRQSSGKQERWEDLFDRPYIFAM